MKRLFILILIPFFTLVAAQVSPNRFDEQSESAFETTKGEIPDQNNDGPVVNKNPGNPGDNVPIDQYVVVLIVAALGIIIYTTQKKKKLLSSTKEG